MQVLTGIFQFTAPLGYQDITNYTFRGPHKGVLLMVTYGEPTLPEQSAEATLAELRLNIEEGLPAPLIEGAEQASNLGAYPARAWSFLFGEETRSYRENWRIALLRPELYLHLTYTVSESDDTANSVFDHICDSLRLAEEKVQPATPPGYTRRQADLVTLDVPIALASPQTYQFVLDDETVKIAFTHLPSNPIPRRQAFLETALQAEIQYGATLSDVIYAEIHTPVAVGTLVQYRLTGNSTAARIGRQALLDFEGERHVHLVAQAAARTAERMDSDLARLIDSITPLR